MAIALRYTKILGCSMSISSSCWYSSCSKYFPGEKSYEWWWWLKFRTSASEFSCYYSKLDTFNSRLRLWWWSGSVFKPWWKYLVASGYRVAFNFFHPHLKFIQITWRVNTLGSPFGPSKCRTKLNCLFGSWLMKEFQSNRICRLEFHRLIINVQGVVLILTRSSTLF